MERLENGLILLFSEIFVVEWVEASLVMSRAVTARGLDAQHNESVLAGQLLLGQNLVVQQ